MDLQIINQTPGKQSMLSKLKLDLQSTNHTLRVLVAYLSWNGLKMIYKELERFYDEGNNVKMIVGLSNDAKEIHVLRYLRERMPRGDFLVFNASNMDYIFHPKLFFFDNYDSLSVYIGSSNLSSGGLYTNSECVVKVTLNRIHDKKLITDFEDIWTTYSNPKEPFTQRNLLSIDSALLNKITKEFQKSVDGNGTTDDDILIVKRLFPTILFPEIKESHLPQEEVYSDEESFTEHTLDIEGNILFLEVLTETGAGGTQIQIPTVVVKEYFGMDQSDRHKTIEVSIGSDQYRPAVISGFENFTYRISINEVLDIERPLLMRFNRQTIDKYSIDILTGEQYNRKIADCINQTRFDSKRWLIE